MEHLAPMAPNAPFTKLNDTFAEFFFLPDGHKDQGAGKRPRQCCHPKGPRTKGTATRGPEGPESGQNMRVRGPEDELCSVPVLALASATICFSRFSQKSRFSLHNLSNLMTAKMHENFNRVSYLRYKHRVKK